MMSTLPPGGKPSMILMVQLVRIGLLRLRRRRKPGQHRNRHDKFLHRSISRYRREPFSTFSGGRQFRGFIRIVNAPKRHDDTRGGSVLEFRRPIAVGMSMLTLSINRAGGRARYALPSTTDVRASQPLAAAR